MLGAGEVRRIGRHLRDLYQGPVALGRYWLTLEYHLVDVSTCAGLDLRGAPWLQAVLAAMRHIGSPGLTARLPALMSEVATAEAEPGLSKLWQAVLT